MQSGGSSEIIATSDFDWTVFVENNLSINIEDIVIAAPCDRKWGEMRGNNKVRRCSACRLDVHNTTEMTESEIQNLFAGQNNRICLKIYRTTDGKILTKNCAQAKRIFELARRKIRLALATLLGMLNFIPGWCQEQFTSVDRYGMTINPRQYFTDPDRVSIQKRNSQLKEEGAKSSALDAYSKARQYESEKKPQLALLWYKAAIQIFRADQKQHDPKFKQLVARNYVQLLKNNSEHTTAKKIEQEFNCQK